MREMAGRGFNFELKSEKDIAQDIISIEEKGWKNLFNVNLLEIAVPLSVAMFLGPEALVDDEQDLNELRVLIDEFKKNYSKEKPDIEAIEEIKRFLKIFILNVASPESLVWVKSEKRRILTPKKLAELTKQRMLESKIQFKDDLERFEYALKTQRKIIRENLHGEAR